ncbi:hypothetical protein [Pseudonocardia sp. N23]|uniref:hypothetical protein n=1 Tax=Pseudonocardia sp. N23 TaxID=1987376 RepID=UPI000BFB2A71|nr:hypothetical protein [Pseudonocardia sp. N23]GAY11586.1 hypothetical protein TOK_6096 [Pseudonocardia sp. N23]
MRSPHPFASRPATTDRAGAPVRPDTGRGVAVTFHGDDDVVVSVRGPLDDATVRRATRLLAVVDTEGVRHVILDAATSPEAPAALRGVLDPLRARLQARGGWLLVEGAAAVPHEPSLLEVFAAYSQAVRGAGGPSAPAVPAPRERARGERTGPGLLPRESVPALTG